VDIEQQALTPTGVMIARVLVEQSIVCVCGQDLDGCWRSHCPRCGISVRLEDSKNPSRRAAGRGLDLGRCWYAIADSNREPAD
jgi:hypothetical protein